MRAEQGKDRPLPDAAPFVSGADGSALPQRRTENLSGFPPHSWSAIEPRRVGDMRIRSSSDWSSKSLAVVVFVELKSLSPSFEFLVADNAYG
jgi:hypothetical protein